MVLAALLPLSLFAKGQGEKAAEGASLTLWHRWSGANAQYLQEVVDAFKAKNQTVKVEVVAKPGEYIELLQSMIADMAAGNKPPDMFVGGYNMLEYIATELKPNPLDQMAPSKQAYDELASRFEPAVWNITNLGGKQIGAPFALSNICMYINMDIFKAAGLSEADFPKTWDDMFAIGKVIKQKTGKYVTAIQLPDNWADCSLVYSAGGTLKSADGKYVDFTNAGIAEALTMWQRLYNEKLIPVCTDTELQADFSAGNIATYCTTIMKIGGLKSQSKFDLRTTQFPSFGTKPRKLAAGGAAIVSFSKTKANKDGVWRFMDYALSKDGMDIFTKTGYLCVTKADVAVSEFQKPCIAQKPYAFTWPSWPGGSAGLEIDRLYLNTRTKIIMENLPAGPALKKLTDDCNALLK